MLYNRPVCLGVGYFIINLKAIETRADFEAIGFPKHKSKSETDENELSIKNGEGCEQIGYEWAFGVFMPMYQEPAGEPVVRIATQLNGLETIIYREFGVGVRNPEGG